jgi:exopolysaccharide production protein ExoF
VTRTVKRHFIALAWQIMGVAACIGASPADATEQGPGAEPLKTALSVTRANADARSVAGMSSEPVKVDDGEGDATDLRNAARITLNFRGYPDLSRDYRISADGTVSVPVIGRLKVSSMTPSSLEQALAAKMASVIGSEAYVTVEIAEYRPVFVTGYVAKSESSSWQPGMTVLQAIATSGGIYRAAAAAAGFNSMPAEIERTRIKKAANDLKVSLAVLARLRAEQAEAVKIEMPPELVALVGQAEAQALIASQTSLMQSHVSGNKDQLAAINRGRELGRKELDGLNAQNAIVTKLLGMRRTYKDKIEDLQTRGIVVASRSMDEEIKVSDLEEKGVNIAVATARILATIALAERDGVKLRLDNRATIETDISRMEHDVAQFTI